MVDVRDTSGQIEALAQEIRGELIQRHHDSYDEVRKLHNGMNDKRPELIAQCRDAADVQSAVRFARESGLPTAIRSGGHNGPGFGSVDDGLMIDLSPMKGVLVDPETGTVLVQGGCTWGDVDHATHAFGLAVPSGIISTTGVGGLTLGGGLGHLTRGYGLTIDNLLAADVVLADGSSVRASEETHPDLFWALRGGGGNFGVVTSFKFRGNPVSTVQAGFTLWPLEQATDVVRWYREFITSAPEELGGFFGFHTIPPVEPFPEELWMQKMALVVWCYTGPEDEAEALFSGVQEVGRPAAHLIVPMPFPTLQSFFDGLYAPGHQWYWKADFVTEIPDEAIEQHLRFAERLPTLHSTMHLYPIDGAAHRVGRNDTAFSYREANWGMVIAGVDPDPANRALVSEWATSYWEAVHPFTAGGAYVNMMMEEGQDRVEAAYRDNYRRLTEVKARYDPENLFHINQNIRPIGA